MSTRPKRTYIRMYQSLQIDKLEGVFLVEKDGSNFWLGRTEENSCHKVKIDENLYKAFVEFAKKHENRRKEISK